MKQYFDAMINPADRVLAFTEPGCKNPENDPHASLGDDYKSGLEQWCTTKKASAVFDW